MEEDVQELLGNVDFGGHKDHEAHERLIKGGRMRRMRPSFGIGLIVSIVSILEAGVLTPLRIDVLIPNAASDQADKGLVDSLLAQETSIKIRDEDLKEPDCFDSDSIRLVLDGCLYNDREDCA